MCRAWVTPATGSMELPEYPVSDDDEAFLSSFEECRLPEPAWTHLAHIRVAWICLCLDDTGKALQRIRSGILRYNTEVLKRPHRYHETVTIAYAHVIADRMIPGEGWQEFAGRIDDMLDRNEPLLLRYYSSDRLFSDESRQRFVDADLRPLPALEKSG